MSKQKLLAIDWPPSFAQRVRLAAAERDLEIRIAGTPREFMALYPRYQPDVVAFQVFMMETDGIELIHWLGTQERKASVLLSAGHEPRYAEAAKVIAEITAEIEVTVVLHPDDESELKSGLDGVLQAARSNGQAKAPIQAESIHE